METARFDHLPLALMRLLTRRTLAGVLGLSAAGLPAMIEAKNKKKKRKQRKKKRRKSCGKAGGNPVRGKCCAGSVLVGGICQRCDICARGCAFASVQAAIDVANPGATLFLCAGTYQEALFITDKNVGLIGAGGQDGPISTTLQGAGDRSVVRTEASTVRLENLRISGGGETNGNGIQINGGALELIGCTVSGNTGPENRLGGGIFNNSGSTLTLRNSVVSENEATYGGGIYNAGTLSLIASEIRGNEAGLGGGIGGGIYSSAALTVDTTSRVTGNTASTKGGGIYNAPPGTATLSSSASVSGNMPNNCAGTVPQCID